MKTFKTTLCALALGAALAGPAMADPTSNTQTVALPLVAGTLSISDVVGGQASTFTGISLTGLAQSAVPLTLSGSVPTYLINNPGASSAGFSVSLSAAGPTGLNPPTNLGFSGSAGVVTAGTGAESAITPTYTGGAIQTAACKVLKVVPSGANPPYGQYTYALGTTGWTVDVPAAASPSSAGYVWTLTATISNTP